MRRAFSALAFFDPAELTPGSGHPVPGLAELPVQVGLLFLERCGLRSQHVRIDVSQVGPQSRFSLVARVLRQHFALPGELGAQAVPLGALLDQGRKHIDGFGTRTKDQLEQHFVCRRLVASGRLLLALQLAQLRG